MMIPATSAMVKYATQLRRAHQSVITQKKARTRLATLDASVSNPCDDRIISVLCWGGRGGPTQVTKLAPMRDEPRYPAGRVICYAARISQETMCWREQPTEAMPPRIRVEPPSYGSS